MITNFEKETHELSKYELLIIPLMVSRLKNNIGKDKAVKNQEINRQLKIEGFKVNAVRVRKLIHHIRVHGLIRNLIASNNGYYVATKQEEVDKFVLSLQQRINSIESVKNSFQ